MFPTLGIFVLLTSSTFFNFFPTVNTATELKTYIVHLSSPENQPLEIEKWYNTFLSKVASRSNHKPEMVHAYRHVITGFSAKMTPDQAKMMENLTGVLSVRPEVMHQLHTTRSPYFLGLRQNSGLWKDSNYGKGIIIGVLDTGITPGHPSFNDDNVPAPPSTWTGKCEVEGCNNKLIGIRTFINGSSLVDDIGHGTHTSSTAAGNLVEDVNVFGLEKGTVIGMAPLAHLAMYRVCDKDGFCTDGDILAGMDAAIEDGVHVISISIGGYSSPFYDDSIAVATFSMIQKGIFVSCSAGNSGPRSESVVNTAPWILTVGASTTDRRFRTSVLLGNKILLHGESLYQPNDSDHKLRRLVYPIKDGEDSAMCDHGSLDDIDVKGKVVLCDTGLLGNIAKGEVVKNAGGTAMIVANNKEYLGSSIAAEAHVILASYVGYKEGVEIKKYLNSTSSPVATVLCGGTVVGLKSEPEMAFFSSRGPNTISPGILKPDITGPGVDIFAAWHESIDSRTGTNATFNVIRGTSMSCPHLAGVAALLKSAHPEWSPAVVKSALMTTASQVNRKQDPILDQRLLPADVFAIGSGHVNPTKAHHPGLVFDIQPEDYIPYLCGLGYTTKQIEIIVKKKASCLKTIEEAGLNYPSFAVSLKRGDTKRYTRTVTNVGYTNSSYTIRDISFPKGVFIEVLVHDEWNLTQLKFTSLKQKLTYEVKFNRDNNDVEKGPYGQGHMTWIDDTGKYTVRTPFSFKFE